MVAGADFDQGLPCFFLPLSSKGTSECLERELRVPVFDGAIDTGGVHVETTAKLEVKDQFFYYDDYPQ